MNWRQWLGGMNGSRFAPRLESWFLVRHLTRKHGRDRGMELAVGGNDAFGDFEMAVLDHFGLRDGDYLIDVGCGSGRLTRRVAKLASVRYLGTDISRPMLNHARATCGRPDFRFEQVERLTIPEADGVADMVSFFSVGTHLLNEEFFVYLEEAHRVLKPAGRIVFSFLDFRQSVTRHVFQSMVEAARLGRRVSPINMFFGEDAITAWADLLGMARVDMVSGSDPRIVPSDRVTRALGRTVPPVRFGQSIAVLEKKADSTRSANP
jgi:SAM-dependent methyltransferase